MISESLQETQHSLGKSQGSLTSWLVPGDLVHTTGLLDINDEVSEVNGIEVSGKSFDQVIGGV